MKNSFSPTHKEGNYYCRKCDEKFFKKQKRSILGNWKTSVKNYISSPPCPRCGSSNDVENLDFTMNE